MTAADASAYCLHKYTGFKSFARWTTIPVTYRVSSSLTDTALLAAIDAAFKTWENVPCSRLAFTKGASFDVNTTQFTSPPGNEIYVFWYPQALSSKFPTQPQFAAYSFTGHNNNGGLSFGSIALNGFQYNWNATGGSAQSPGILDMQNEVIYLVGTVIGLTDSKNSAAAMNPNIKFGDTSRHTLHQDDIDAVTWLYAKDTTCMAPAPGTDGCSSGSPVTPPVGDAGINPNPNQDAGTIPPPTEQGVQIGDGGTTNPGSDGGTTNPGSDGGTTNPGSDGGASGGDGSSGKSCTSSAQCGDNAICDVNGQCVSVPGNNPGGGDDGGCGCKTAGLPVGAAPLGLLLLGLLLCGRFLRRRP
ncbi:MAG: matrixin family metalloprotease [Myxococcales bacterium]|nr:matrixin family metalloprotease [Myxococcales bacterium]